ncbi:MAG TPA: hypothetical protein VMH22_05270 [bacterium]|nr:hypothetical protein [bacterium]
MEGLVELLQSLSRQSQKLARQLVTYRSLLAQPMEKVHARASAIAELGAAVQAFPDAEVRQRMLDWLRAESEAIEQSRAEFRFQFGRQLVSGLEGSGMAVSGQLPLLRVGLFTLRTDFDAGTATIYWGPEIEKLKSGIALAPTELAATLRKWNDRLRQKSVPPDRLLSLSHRAYQRVCTFKGLGEGTRVFLLDLLSELVVLMQPESFRLNPAREKFVEYPRVRFSYDLFRLKQAGAYAVGEVQLKLHVANFDATTEKAKALWVPDSEEGGGTHYSYISFGR